MTSPACTVTPSHRGSKEAIVNSLVGRELCCTGIEPPQWTDLGASVLCSPLLVLALAPLLQLSLFPCLHRGDEGGLASAEWSAIMSARWATRAAFVTAAKHPSWTRVLSNSCDGSGERFSGAACARTSKRAAGKIEAHARRWKFPGSVTLKPVSDSSHSRAS